MNILWAVLIIVFAIGYLPVMVFLIIKFGAAAYFREKQKQQNNKEKNNEPIQ